MRIWINPTTNEELAESLRNRLSTHSIVESITEAEVIYGRTAPAKLLECKHLRWIHVDAAGYENFDTPEIRKWAAELGIPVTNSSSVYAEPCAQHSLALMLAASRDLMASWQNQNGSRDWPMLPIRARSTLLLESRVLLLGYGAIARRLAELLLPFKPQLRAFRRSTGSNEGGVEMVRPEDLNSSIEWADHVVNLLPSNGSTKSFVDGEKLKHFSRDSVYYSIGRGTTTDQEALIEALRLGRPKLAYLDVTDPEPLPSNHELWTLPNCFITPHTAGGHTTEPARLISHFLHNLEQFESGGTLADRIF